MKAQINKIIMKCSQWKSEGFHSEIIPKLLQYVIAIDIIEHIKSMLISELHNHNLKKLTIYGNVHDCIIPLLNLKVSS